MTAVVLHIIKILSSLIWIIKNYCCEVYYISVLYIENKHNDFIVYTKRSIYGFTWRSLLRAAYSDANKPFCILSQNSGIMQNFSQRKLLSHLNFSETGLFLLLKNRMFRKLVFPEKIQKALLKSYGIGILYICGRYCGCSIG